MDDGPQIADDGSPQRAADQTRTAGKNFSDANSAIFALIVEFAALAQAITLATVMLAVRDEKRDDVDGTQ